MLDKNITKQSITEKSVAIVIKATQRNKPMMRAIQYTEAKNTRWNNKKTTTTKQTEPPCSTGQLQEASYRLTFLWPLS